MNYKRISKWLTLDMVVFAAANAILIWRFQDRFDTLNQLGYFHLLILGLAVYRAANIISNEAVTKPIRAPFVDKTHKDGKIIEQPKNSGFTGAMGLLIFCPSCTGVWIAATLVYLYILFPQPTFLIAFFLALSALERIVTSIIDRLRNHA